jgi:hypothetical protein
MNNQTKSIEFHNTRVLPEYDVCIHTSDGTRIPAHTSILVITLSIMFLFFRNNALSVN